MRFKFFCLLALSPFLAGCLPSANFELSLRIIDEQTGEPISDAWVFVTAYVQADPPFEEPYNKPLAGMRAKTDSKGIAKLKDLKGLSYRGEPQDKLWKAIVSSREDRYGKPKRRISGIEGGNIVVLAKGYGLLSALFGIKENPRYQERLKEWAGRYPGVVRLGLKGGDENLVEFTSANLTKGTSLTIKMNKPEKIEHLQASYCPSVLSLVAWAATSEQTGASMREKKSIHDFIIEGMAQDLDVKAFESCGHGSPSNWANPEFEQKFLTHDLLMNKGHDDTVRLWMTQKALEILPAGYGEIKRHVEDIKKGVIAEEEDKRGLNHFYNPNDPENKMGQGEQALKWAAIGYPDNPNNDWDWQDARRYYLHGDKAKAYKALGHVLNVLANLSIPANTRLIEHSPGLESARYETYFAELAKNSNDSLPPEYSFEARTPKRAENLMEHFEQVARLTFGAFTADNQVVNFDDYYRWRKGQMGEMVKTPEDQVLARMGRRLMPRIIEHAGGIIKEFYDGLHPALSVQAPRKASDSDASSSKQKQDESALRISSEAASFSSRSFTQTPTDQGEPSRQVDKFIPAIDKKEGKDLSEAVHDLQEELDRLSNSKKRIDGPARKKLSAALLMRARTVDRKEPLGDEAYSRIVELAIRHGDWADVRDMALSFFESTAPQKRARLLRAISSKSTSMSKDEAIQTINSLHAKKLIESRDRWREAARIDPDHYLPEIKKVLGNTRDKEEFKGLALVVQSHNDFSVFAHIIPRLKQLGLDKDNPNTGFSWIDHRLFARYLQAADGDDLIRALEVLQMGGGSTISAAPVILQRKLLGHPDQRVRLPAVDQIRKAVGAGVISPDEAEVLFRERLSAEKDPEVLKRLSDSLSALASYRKAFKRLEKMRSAQ